MTDELTWAGTFHGIGARLLREYAEGIGFDAPSTIHDREDSADLLKPRVTQVGVSKTESRFPAKGTCRSIYSRCVKAEAPIEAVLGQNHPWCDIAAEMGGRFDQIMVDEHQDTNRLPASCWH